MGGLSVVGAVVSRSEVSCDGSSGTVERRSGVRVRLVVLRGIWDGGEMEGGEAIRRFADAGDTAIVRSIIGIPLRGWRDCGSSRCGWEHCCCT